VVHSGHEDQARPEASGSGASLGFGWRMRKERSQVFSSADRAVSSSRPWRHTRDASLAQKGWFQVEWAAQPSRSLSEALRVERGKDQVGRA
jgi:hypothetical protein